MSDSTIGIKVADGSFYPVLEPGYTGKKRLTLTTVKDNQEKVQIDMYQGKGPSLEDAQYIGSLIIENITPAPKGTPDIELVLGLDANGELTAEARDRSTGESQSFSISLKTLSAEETYEVPDFEMEPEATKVFPATTQVNVAQTLNSADSANAEVAERRPPSRLAIILIVLLVIVAIGVVVFFLVRGLPSKAVPTPTQVTPPPAAVTPPPAAQGQAPVAQAESSPGATAEPVKTAPVPEGGVSYRIKKGDTLWDISSTYYRNPWLYPKLAKANNIKNPDLIFAGAKLNIPAE